MSDKYHSRLGGNRYDTGVMFRRYGILLHPHEGLNLACQRQWCLDTAQNYASSKPAEWERESNEERNCTLLK